MSGNVAWQHSVSSCSVSSLLMQYWVYWQSAASYRMKLQSWTQVPKVQCIVQLYVGATRLQYQWQRATSNTTHCIC
jgi:hypothetical protein